MIVPAHQVLYSKLDKLLGHFRRYTAESLSSKANASGLKVINAKYFNWIAFFGWLVFVKIMGRTTMPKNEVGIFDRIGRYFLWTEKFINPPFGLSVFLVARK